MLKYKMLVLGAALGLGLAGPVIAQDTTADTVVASVNGNEITLGHMIALRMTLSQEDQQLPPDVLFPAILERLIQQSAMSQTADEVSAGIELRLENERNALIASDIVGKIATGIDITEEKVQAAYDTRFADFAPSVEYNASHILVETEEEAIAIVADLTAGADFAETAMAKSTGPSGPGGGELGWFGQGRMVPEFEAAVQGMEKGAISDPVQTQFGWHVIKLNDTRLPEAPSLQEVRPSLEEEVWRTELRDGIDAIVNEVGVERPDISGIDPSVLSDTSLIGY